MSETSRRGTSARWSGILGAVVLGSSIAAATFFAMRGRRERAWLAAGQIGRERGVEAEVDPSVARSSDGALVVSWMSVTRDGEGSAARSIGARVSRDHGVTWSSIDHVSSGDGRFATDSMLAADAQGNVTLTWLGFRANLARGTEPRELAVFASRANDASGMRFGEPTEITRGAGAGHASMGFDKPWSAALADGTWLTTYRFDAPDVHGIGVSRSRDGRSFAHAIVAGGLPFGGTLPTICASESGARAWVAYVDASRSIWAKVVVHRSDDGGATFPESARAIASQPGEHAVVEAPWCRGDRDDLWIAYGLGVTPPDSSSSALYEALVLAHSTDGGLTFSLRRELRSSLGPMLHPTLARTDDGGLAVLYQTSRDLDSVGETRLALLSREGVELSAARTISTSTRLTKKRDPAKGWTGDFLGLASDGSSLAIAAGQVADGAPHVFFREVAP